MAAFLGLGIGFALAKRKKDYLKWFIPFLVIFVPVVLSIGQFEGGGLVVPESGEYFWGQSALPAWLSTIVFALIVVLLFLYTMFLFIPLGQLTGRLMLGFKPISAYMINLSGSLVGIWAFALVSFLYLPPSVWFGLGLVIVLWFLRKVKKEVIIGLLTAIPIVVILVFSRGDIQWSPYYRVDVLPMSSEDKVWPNPEETGFELRVNKIAFMTAVNLAPEYLESHPDYAEATQDFNTIYNLPYSLMQPENVLIVGAGTGNDTAAALRGNASNVDAVEIDPLILDISQSRHPEKPYDSPKVNLYVDDARAYFEKTDQKYDLIVFGILDSQTLLSGMSSVRLDNFVYTVESLEQVRELLNEDGMVAITFFVQREWIKQRLAKTLLEVFEEPPVQLSVGDTTWVMYFSGNHLGEAEIARLCESFGCAVETPEIIEQLPLATDDWPYLYLQERGIPLPYWIVLVIVVFIAWVSMRKAFPATQGMDWHFFLLGGAFLLIEFKSITELALLFGSTWIVNAIAISVVIIMVLFANFIVSRSKKINLNLLYVLLFLSLLVGFVIPYDILLPYGAITRILASSLLLGLPLFFSSAIFSVSIKDKKDAPMAFASNFFGSAVGGVLEYSSLTLGISGLYLIGLVLYIGAWFVRPRG